MNTSLHFISRSFKDFPKIIDENVSALRKEGVILEIGGGANPLLSENEIIKKVVRYIVIDKDQSELDKSEGVYYEKRCLDITKEPINIKADLIISQMVLEHIALPDKFHEACYKMLNIEGKAIHFFATKYSPASIVNLVLPERWSSKLLKIIQKRNWEKEGKFPAYYKMCLGPVKKQIEYFNQMGFIIESYQGYLGQNYFKKWPLLRFFEKGWNTLLMTIKSPFLCSNSIIILKK